MIDSTVDEYANKCNKPFKTFWELMFFFCFRQKIPLKLAKDPSLDSDYDCLIVIALRTGNGFLEGPYTGEYAEQLTELSRYDASLDSEGGFLLLPVSHKIRRLVYSPVGPINRDQDDVRRFRDAAYKGMIRAMKAGANAPIIVIPSLGPFANLYRFVGILQSLSITSFSFLQILRCCNCFRGL